MPRAPVIVLAGLLSVLALGGAAPFDRSEIRITASVDRQCGVASGRVDAGGLDLVVDCRGSIACVAALRHGADRALRRASGGCALNVAGPLRADEVEVQF